MINKTVKNAQEAVADIPSNAMLMMGGFGLCGIPENCIKAAYGIHRYFAFDQFVIGVVFDSIAQLFDYAF